MTSYTGHLIREATDDRRRREKAEEALKLAANRLDRLVLDMPWGSRQRSEVAEWAAEARAALPAREEP